VLTLLDHCFVKEQKVLLACKMKKWLFLTLIKYQIKDYATTYQSIND